MPQNVLQDNMEYFIKHGPFIISGINNTVVPEGACIFQIVIVKTCLRWNTKDIGRVKVFS